eukprot:gnl/TRDRNA2_/TRDRNA2_29904_c0_seq1.p1 gnl/TRDRNA2_/TRDRNA2_29904_c0~~gnl/TRDRNA2_/TRDRNA2_29904_c0_seq1.p1  ORF type:complete len:344 (-),score=38.84 gnl/TRDRNA2_/TRDRNA2_29904_c0_seq1:46-936(-)
MAPQAAGWWEGHNWSRTPAWHHGWHDDEQSSWWRAGSDSWASRDGRYGSSWRKSDEDWILEAADTHRHTIMWFHSCHGRPDNVTSFLDDLRDHGTLTGRHDIRTVSPCAPKRACDYSSKGSYQWFEYLERVSDGRVPAGEEEQDGAHLEQLREQRGRLLRLLDEELQRLPQDGYLMLGGLSQGASIALDLLLHLRSPLAHKIRGLVARRGCLQRESVQDLPQGAVPSRLAGFPILASHGTADDLVPIQSARHSYAFLRECGARLDFRVIYGMGHKKYCKEESAALADFTRELFRGL